MENYGLDVIIYIYIKMYFCAKVNLIINIIHIAI